MAKGRGATKDKVKKTLKRAITKRGSGENRTVGNKLLRKLWARL
jgi:hypothetical protein